MRRCRQLDNEYMTKKAQRRSIVIGNWKMNGDVTGNERLLGALRLQLDRSLPEPAPKSAPRAPGSDPDKPPILRF